MSFIFGGIDRAVQVVCVDVERLDDYKAKKKRMHDSNDGIDVIIAGQMVTFCTKQRN